MKKISGISLVTVLLSLSLMTGCGSSESESAAVEAGGSYREAAAAEDSAYMAESADYDNQVLEGEDGLSTKMSGENSTGAIELTDEKIVYTTNMSISSKNFDESVSATKALAKKYSAVIQSESYSDPDTSWYTSGGYRRGSYRQYDLSLRVPRKNYESFLNSAGEIEGVVDYRNSTAENISQSYYDTKEVISAYEDELKRLKELMAEADKMADIIVIEEKITNVQTLLNQERSNLRRMDTDVSYSYVNMTINEVAVYVKEEKKERTYAEKLIDAFVDSIDEFRTVLGNFILWIVRHWAFLIFLGLVIFGIIKLKNRNKGLPKMSRKERREAKKAAKLAAQQKQGQDQNMDLSSTKSSDISQDGQTDKKLEEENIRH
ncbi:MAG: DUF4349 domain-containing protein [Lachnospiraceae bacterium]|nr:DUF4349 domain-containing protein [Lachnospiraceae bacterium]